MEKATAKFIVRGGSFTTDNPKKTEHTWDIDITNWSVDKIQRYQSEIKEIIYE